MQSEGARVWLHGAEGNPLFVLELLEALAEDGVLTFEGGRVDIRSAHYRPSLRLTLLRRVAHLRPPVLDVIRVASVLGATFEVGDLSLVTGQSAVDLLPLVQQALDSGCCRPRRHRGGLPTPAGA